ncbi:MAG: cysteine hydrolase [Clostridium sp.]|nr:cysteine hydrolase [Clostridium sp.]
MQRTNRTAMVVLDMQNQFTNKKGCLFYETTEKVIPAILDGIQKLRERGVLIVYANSESEGEECSLDTEVLKRRDPVPPKGSWDAEMDERLEVLPEDLVISHFASSAFFGTELEKKLKEKEIRNVIVCGVKTNYDVRATATDAMWRQFQAYAASDMVASDTVERSKIHLEELTKYTAKAIPLEEIIRRIEEGRL